MRVPAHLVAQRRDRLAQLLAQHRYLPLADICRHLSVSEATARRDLAALQSQHKVTRTYGGALLDFDAHFPSFHQRAGVAPAQKRAIAQAAAGCIPVGCRVCYLDAGTTMLAVAEALAALPQPPPAIVTNNLPVAESLVRDLPACDVSLIGGRFLARQSALLGRVALRSLRLWRFDCAFLSAQGLNRAGLWNSEDSIAAFQRAVIGRSARSYVCLDSSKLGRAAPSFLLPLAQIPSLITDAGPGALREHGVRLPAARVISAVADS